MSRDNAIAAPEAGDLEPPQKAGKPSLYAWYVLAVLVLVYAFNWMDRYIFVILMEPLKQELRLSDTILGLLGGFAFSAMYATAGIPIARLADKSARKPVIAIGLAVWSGMTAACGLAMNAAQMALARVGVGLGEAACSPPSHSMISDYFPRNTRGFAFAIHGLGLYVGMTAGLMLGGEFNAHFGWRVAFMALGLPGLALALLFMLTVREPPRPADADAHAEHAQGFGAVVRFMATRKSFAAYAVGVGLFSFAANAVNVWSGVVFMRIHGMSSADAGLWTGGLGGAAGVLGTIVFGLMADRLGQRNPRWYLWTPSLAIALLVPATAALLFGSTGWVMAGYFLGIACAASCLAPTIAITQELMPARMRALSSAVLALCLNFIGIGAGNLVVGALTDALTVQFGVDALRVSLSVTTLFGAVSGIALTLYGASRLLEDLRNRPD